MAVIILILIIYNHTKKLNPTYFKSNENKYFLVYDDLKDYYILRNCKHDIRIYQSDIHSGYFIKASISGNKIFYSNVITIRHLKKFLKQYKVENKQFNAK